MYNRLQNGMRKNKRIILMRATRTCNAYSCSGESAGRDPPSDRDPPSLFQTDAVASQQRKSIYVREVFMFGLEKFPNNNILSLFLSFYYLKMKIFPREGREIITSTRP